MVLSALWVSPVSDIGGVSRHFVDVARSRIPGWRVVFLVPSGDLAEQLRDLGAPVIEAAFGPGAGLASSTRALRTAIARLRPRVVHTHLSYADIVAPAAAAGLGTALVTTEHGIAADDVVYHRSALRSRVMAGVHSARLRRYAAAIAVSEATRAAMIAKWRPRCPVEVIHNGVDHLTAAAPTPGLRVASLARLAPEKGIESLIGAFAVLLRTHPDATLTIAGDGPLRDRLVEAARPLGDSVRFPGFVPAERVLAEADVIVQLSVWENCSYTLLDAQAAGLGVVATRVGGNPELLPERCLVEPTSPGEVAAAILRQGTDVAERPRLGSWPRVPDMCAKIGALYSRLVSPAGGP
ncbi:MAG: glycosyltransferase family 4 protein [Propionibacteriaceae bacterium]|nr:glycosyltransferase family 4 protein [Propionibacteriaceae bacterium]